MALHQLQFEQFVPASLDEAWDFFSSPKNLKEITPKEMGFEITSVSREEKMYPGMIISYRVKPLWGIPMQWVSEITHIREKEYFIDEQRIGPYAMWSHRHTFTPVEGGVRMGDLIHYAVRFGLVGNLANRLFVRSKIEEIFAYRTRRVEEIFGVGSDLS